jgi:hypothetical protein
MVLGGKSQKPAYPELGGNSQISDGIARATGVRIFQEWEHMQ